MVRLIGLCLLVLVLNAAAARPALGARVSDFVDFSLQSGGSTLLPGRMYVPPEAASEARPLIVFLHGAGERGTNNLGQINGNIDNLLAAAKLNGAFLYAPQTAGGWSSATELDNVMTMVDRALQEQNVLENQLYATGLSMGGGGTWNLLNRHGDRFAAAVPVCAVSPAFGFDADNLVDLPTWAFHARNDTVVSHLSTRNAVASILTAAGAPLPSYPSRQTTDFHFESGAIDLRYTEYVIGGHGIWGRVYGTPQMYQWLFSHSTAIPEPSAVYGFSLALITTAAFRRRRCAIAAA